MGDNALTRVKKIMQCNCTLLFYYCARTEKTLLLSRSMARYFAQPALIYKSTFLVDAFSQQPSILTLVYIYIYITFFDTYIYIITGLS